MDAVTYPDPAVRTELLEHWVEVRVDLERHAEVFELLGVAAIPTAMVVGPQGRVLDVRTGFVEPDEFAAWLERIRGKK